MVWLKKVKFIILSVFLFTSCEGVSTLPKNDSTEDKVISQEDLVEVFFNQIEDWSSDSILKIDSIGIEITKMDSTLSYHSYENDDQPNAFMFSAQEEVTFQVFEESKFLKQSKPIQQSVYKVWRKKLGNLEILDLSIEPHPSLNWVFVIRKRGQE